MDQNDFIVGIFILFLGIILGSTLYAFWPSLFIFIIGGSSEWFWMMMQSLGILAGFWFLQRQIKLYRHSNSIQIMSSLRRNWNSIEMRRLRLDVCKHFISQQPRAKILTPSEAELLDFCEEIAVYYYEGVIDKKFLWSSYSYFFEFYWYMLRERVQGYRNRYRDQALYENFEHLMEELYNLTRRRDIPTTKNIEDILAFAKEEIDIASTVLGHNPLP